MKYLMCSLQLDCICAERLKISNWLM